MSWWLAPNPKSSLTLSSPDNPGFELSRSGAIMHSQAIGENQSTGGRGGIIQSRVAS